MQLKMMVVASAASVFILGSAGAIAAPNFEGGLWETTVSMNAPGMPAMPPRTTRQCMTKDDIDPHKALSRFNSNGHENQCKVSDYKEEGNTITWKTDCSGAHPAMTGTFSATYKGASFTMVAHGKANEGSQTMEFTMNASGKRVGACKQ
ncbi:MAG TPA: DUF3617 family protein [Burkholderiales bacterium]|nr:DUF3617 family protein [Burkholderiales bacterium]